jgi:hypothetical protein
MGIKKINLFNINDNSTIDLFNMPAEVKQLALTHLQEAQDWHKNALHPEDRDLYPWSGVDTLIEYLKRPTPVLTTLANFESKIKWYDQWSTKKFADLWPNLNQLVHNTLK